MNTDKLMQYFFIIAAVVAILDGAFKVNQEMQALKFVVLVIAGIVVGIFCHERQRDFMISSFVIIVTGYILTQLLGYVLFVQGIGLMLLNFIVFLSAAAVTVAFQVLGDSIAPSLHRVSPEEEYAKLKKLSEREIEHLSFQKIWGTVILIAVALTFIILLAELFYDVSDYKNAIVAVDIVITLLFIVDLVILYKEAGTFKKFVTRNIFDIIAAIPLVGFLRAIKIIRAFRIVRVLRASVKVSKAMKVSKTAKLFSEESYFNTVERHGKVLKQAVAKKKAAKKKKSAKKAKKSTKKKRK